MVGLSDLAVDCLDESTFTASFSIKMILDTFTHYLAGGGVGRRYVLDKLARILHTLNGIVEGNEMEYSELQSIAGKLINVRFLVRGGR